MKKERWIILGVLLICPTLALLRVGLPGVWYGWLLYFVLISVATALVYRHDKKKAELAGRRIPEKILHLLEILGGWPGAYLAQGLFRHKTRKFEFQLLFWIIVGIYQYLALDMLIGWRIAGGIRGLVT